MRADEIVTKYNNGLAVCIIHDSTDLSRMLGPPITTLITRVTDHNALHPGNPQTRVKLRAVVHGVTR